MTENRKTAVYIRLSMEDGNVDGRTKLESDSVTSQRILLKSFVIDQLGVDESDILEYVDATVIIGLKQNPTIGRRFSPIFLLNRAFCGAKRKMLL